MIEGTRGDDSAEGGPQEVAGVKEGQIVGGKYRVEHFIAVGGMGAVVAAHHLQLDTRVAIKFLLPSMLANEEAVARFSREARAAVRITNEHVARVFDVGTLETGAPYMVMEFLHGSDLGTFLQHEGPLDPELAVGFVLQACEAISEAHSLGIVHRDLKPSNLFCIQRADGRQVIKVLDFGISKMTSLANIEPNITQTLASGAMGSPLYMSPEQMEACHTVDARADIWGLGVILYELITGKMPFSGETLPELSVKIATRPPPPLHDSQAKAPIELQGVIFRCLEKDREKRYASIAELAAALLPFGPEGAAASLRRIMAAGTRETSASSLRDRSRLPPTSATLSPSEGPAKGPAIGPRTTRGDRAMGRHVLAAAGILALVLAFAFLLKRTSLRGPDAASSVAGIAPSAVSDAVALPPLVDTQPHPASTTSAAPEPTSPAKTPRPERARTDRGASAAMPHTIAKPATGGPKPAPQMPSAVDPKVDCDPDFYLDEQGRKHFKPECWLSPGASGVSSSGAKAECDPNFYFDGQGQKHFRPECFLIQGR
ncbi:MAG: protein kinase [Polyangiaceae bacterium]